MDTEEERDTKKAIQAKIFEARADFEAGNITEEERDDNLRELLREYDPERYDRTAWGLEMLEGKTVEDFDLDPLTRAEIVVTETQEKILDVENRLYTEEERREVLDDE